MTRVLILFAVLAGCSATYQSARVLDPGKTQVTLGVTRAEGSSQNADADGHIYIGDLQVRRGIASQVEAGFRLTRMPNAGMSSETNVSSAALDLKYQVTPRNARTAVSIALPLGAWFAEDGITFDRQAWLVSPTLLVGTALAPTTELVFGPKLTVILPDSNSADTQTAYGASIGLRFTDPARTWALHPEISVVHYSTASDATLYTFGLAVSAGD